MKTLDRKLLRELRGHLGMLLAVTSIIAVGVACFVTMASSYLNLSEAKRLYYAQCRMADFSIDLKKVPLTELSALAAMPEVAEIRPRIGEYVAVDLPGVAEPLSGLVLSLPDRRGPILDDVVLRQGGYFTDRRDNEVIVNEQFARAHRLRPGQWIRLLLNNRQQELFIVGTAISSEFVYLVSPGAITPDPEHFGVFYLKRIVCRGSVRFQGVGQSGSGAAERGGARQPARSASPRREHAFGLRRVHHDAAGRSAVEQVFEPGDQGAQEFRGHHALHVSGRRGAGAQCVVEPACPATADGGWHVEGAGLLRSPDILAFSEIRHGRRHRRRIARLRAGLVACRGMTSIYRTFFQFPELHSRLHWSVYAAGMLASIGCAALGSLRGSRAVLRLHPAEAMRPAPPRQGGAVLLERIGWFWRSLGSGWRMVLRNLFRSRLRTAACVFAAAMGAERLGRRVYDAIVARIPH